ncbi:MAG: DMT family transporter [Actinobacteria bacterium]|nr:DMT family transporter [Actinomycetota bacterium]
MTTTLLSALLGVCGMFGWGLYDFLGGVLSKRMGSFVPLFWSQAVGAATIGVVAWVVGGTTGVPTRSLLLAPVAAALYCGGYLCFFAGFQKGDVSVVAAAMNLWAVVTMVVAFLFMGQRLSTSQTVGAFTIIAGAMLASVDWGRLRRQGFHVSLGVRETLLGAFFFGVYWNVSEVISEDVGWLRTTLLVKTGVVLVLLALSVLKRRRFRTDGAQARTVLTLVAMGVVEVCAVAAVNYGIAIGDAILVTPIASALSVVTIALAVVVLRDRVSAPQAVGMTMAVAGIVATAL